MSRNLLFCIVFVIAAGAAIIRSYDLVSRPLHNDEGVNHFFLQGIESRGYYEYSHENYHGPAYFYWSYMWWKSLGDDEVGVRGGAVVAGILSLLLIVLLRRVDGPVPTACAVLALALSTSHVYYSKYAIHETLFLFASLGVGISLYLWIHLRESRYIYLGFFSLALIIATKETFIITLACIGFAALFLGGYKASFLTLFKQRVHVYAGLALLILLVSTCFTGGFQWGGGLKEMWLAVPQWIGRNNSDVGHFKPFVYYAKNLLYPTEPWLFLVPVAAISSLLMPLRGPRYFSLWSIAAYLVYSFLNYKTPWLVINITTPASVAVGLWIGHLAQYKQNLVKWPSMILGGLILGVAASKINYYVFQVTFGDNNPFSYVHTSAGMVELAQQIDEYSKSHAGAKILVAVDGYWPLPFYLRKLAPQVAYLVTNEPKAYASEYNVLIMEKEVEFNEPGWTKYYRRLSDVEETNTFFKE